MIESLSSCNEDCNFKSYKKSLSRLPSRSRTYIFPCSRGSSGPNCESDSEGVLTSRAIEKLSICDGKRSVESDYGGPQYSASSKKSIRRRRKTKDTTPMQIDNGLFSNDAIRSFRKERRSLGKRKRWVETDKSSTKSMTSQGDVLEIDKTCHSDGESVDSVISGKIVNPCLTEDDNGRDGDDEQSDWCQEFGLSNGGITPLYEITVGAFFDRTKTPRNSDDNSLSSKNLQRSVSKDGFSRSSNIFNKQLYRRSIKTGNRRLLVRNLEKSKGSNNNNSNSRSFPSKVPNKSITDRHRKFSNKRLRCGSSSFTSFCESNNQMDDMSHTAETIFSSLSSLIIQQPTGKPPFKKGATEKQIFGGHD